MSQSKLNKNEQDLLALMQPFNLAEGEDKSLHDEARSLLAFAESIVTSGQTGVIAPPIWHDYLNITGKTKFLKALDSRKDCYRTADLMFELVDSSNYTLQKMFEQRVHEHPKRLLFREAGKDALLWSYEQVFTRMKKIAAAFYSAVEEPRVLLYLDNSPDGACADLACLTFGILDSPIDRHFDHDTIAYIIKKLGINIVVTDTETRLRRLVDVQEQTGIPLRIFVTDSHNRALRDTDLYLGEASSLISSDEAEDILAKRPQRDLHAVSTVMFTSGSTGEPKGVAFTNYNLVTKRFARAAALPDVGRDEVLFCYLPLFHTFGRYLEMMGMLYWGGTYVFAGNTSRETFLKRLTEVQPTGLIGIPLRWQQIQQQCMEQLDTSAPADEEQAVFRSVVGNRLRWGLSAAGFLSPRAFRFFQRNHVALCSGFGMTESTGGTTMTRPYHYKNNSVGFPLPGMLTRLTEQGELEIGGPYMARYLDELDSEDPGRASFNARTDLKWLKTGDIFKIDKEGQFEIVDRVKDIYKNNRGQTIAPRRVEQKFDDVPGIKRVFLVGDARDYNVLLIVPNMDEQLLSDTQSEQERELYFKNIVTAANKELMPYERVINIAILDRDFDIEKGELTPKGSFRRKQVEKNFAKTINELYVRDYVEFTCSDLTIRVPRWFFRDLGVLESDDIESRPDGLLDKTRDRFLAILKRDDHILVGDLEYEVEDKELDLGQFARQPLLWAGNPSLLAFCPCKEGWDTQNKGIAREVLLPYRKDADAGIVEHGDVSISDQKLRHVHELCISALYGTEAAASAAIDQLESILVGSEDRMASLVASRLEALARHPVENIRCQAYSVILLNRPMTDDRSVYPAFLNSGLSFLNDEFILKIGNKNIERRRLEALRRRMFHYRTRLDWPVAQVMIDQLGKLLTLMADFARNNPEFYYAVRGELASWAVQQTDAGLMKKAETLLMDLGRWHEEYFAGRSNLYQEATWKERMVFEEGITEYEIWRLTEAFSRTAFLHSSLALAFDAYAFDLMKVPAGGIWFSRLLSQRGRNVYRVSVNTMDGNHYELMLTLREDYAARPVRDVLLWLMAISDNPYGAGTLPRLGCSRSDLGILSVAYLNDLTVGERIREISSARTNIFATQRPGFLGKLFTRALAGFFATCRNSGYQIIPGHLSPNNVVVPEPDYRSGVTILSLGGWDEYDGPLSLIRPMIKNFYQQTAMHYPWAGQVLNLNWIFDAAIEGLGPEGGRRFLHTLKDEINGENLASERKLASRLHAFLEKLDQQYHVPLALRYAIERYKEWCDVNPRATPEARSDLIDTLYDLYRLNRFGEIARYHMYRHTYFSDAAKDVGSAFDYLLGVLHEKPELPAISQPALSELQATLRERDDRQVFGQLVFPRAQTPTDLEVLAMGDRNIKQVVVKSQVTARDGTHYYVREATEPSEIGQLYRLFLRQRYQKVVSEQDEFLVVINEMDQLVGGVCYKVESDRVVYLDGLVIAGQLQSNDLGSQLLEDFCMRMSNAGFEVVRTHYYRRNFYLHRSFKTDKRWGGLVRFLTDPPDDDSPE